MSDEGKVVVADSRWVRTTQALTLIGYVIRTEIKGGHVFISLVDTTVEQARGLAAALRGELLHAPLGWRQDVNGAP